MLGCHTQISETPTELARIREQLAAVDVTGDPVRGVATLIEDLRGASAGLRRSSAIATVGLELARELEAWGAELPPAVAEALARVRRAEASR